MGVLSLSVEEASPESEPDRERELLWPLGECLDSSCFLFCANTNSRWLPDRPTTFIVSQRAASVRYADLILVLDDGMLVGSGTHEELLEGCPVYQEVYHSQFPKEVASHG